MSYEKHAKLIELLYKRTLNSTIEWKPSVLEGRYQISFRDNTVRIFETEDGDFGNSIIYLELINEDGIVAETINDEELDRDIPKGEHYWFKRLSRLFETARRSALGSDKILDEILADLDDEIPF